MSLLLLLLHVVLLVTFRSGLYWTHRSIATSTRGRNPSTTSCVTSSAADTICSRSGKCLERPGDLDLSPFDLLTLELLWNVSRGTGNLPHNFRVSASFRCCVMGKRASDWRHDLITLTFDLWRHCACRWCGSSYSICISSSSAVPFWGYVWHCSRRYAAWWAWLLTLRPLNGVTDHPCHELPVRQCSACCALSFST